MKFQLTIIVALFLNATSALAQDAPRTGGDRANPRRQRVTNWLKQQDKNQDGKIAIAESTGLMKTHFRRNDTNNDGVVEWGEFVGMMIKTKSHKGNAYEKMTNITMNEQWKQDILLPLFMCHFGHCL